MKGKYIGAEEMGNGIWRVFYRNVFLGFFDEKIINVKPREIESNWEFKSQQKLLDYLCADLNDKFYYFGVKYELDEQEKPYLIRTKEKMLIEKLDDDFYQLTRTENVIKLMEKPA